MKKKNKKFKLKGCMNALTPTPSYSTVPTYKPSFTVGTNKTESRLGKYKELLKIL